MSKQSEPKTHDRVVVQVAKVDMEWLRSHCPLPTGRNLPASQLIGWALWVGLNRLKETERAMNRSGGKAVAP